MIGIWYKHKNIWKYKRFTCKSATYKEEYRIMKEFVKFIHKHNNPKLWYWVAEKNFWNRSITNQQNRLSDKDDELELDLDNWSDMCQIFKSEPIVIKDCFKFGLKSIAKSMKSHNLIHRSIKSDCSSGMTAMVKAWQCYKEFPNPHNCPIMKDISNYNKFDVSVLEEILSYLRQHHI